jgi:RNA polymerase sigma-70 factor (ECF subfamily)
MKSGNLIVSEALAGAQETLYAMIYVLLEGAFDTMDVLQETNMAILRHADLYDPSRPALPWFKAFAMNQVLYFRRVRHDEKLVFDTDLVNDLADLLAAEEAAEEKQDLFALLEACLKKLPPWQRDLLMERYQKGKKVNEMARKRFLSRVSLSVMMFRIRQALKTCIEGMLAKHPVTGSESDRAFVSNLEALLDGSASEAERCALATSMVERPDLRNVYVSHARLHALMRCRNGRFFADQARHPVWSTAARILRRAAAVAAILGAALAVWGALRIARGAGEGAIAAEAYEEGDAWLAQLSPLDMQAYREHMGFDALQPELAPLQKYEPGSISNPGAGIEIVEPDRLLAKGDRVWRERLTVDSGKLTFKLETGAQVTLFGPAEVELHDEDAVSVVSGTLLVECGEKPLRVTVRGMSVQNRNVTFCVNAPNDRQADVVVLSGTLQAGFVDCGRIGHLDAGDGVRLVKGRESLRFRCLVPERELREKIFAGVSVITMRNRRRS